VVYPRSVNGTQPERGQAHLPNPEILFLESSSLSLCLSVSLSLFLCGYYLISLISYSCPSISGLGFLSADKYVVRGLVFKSPSSE
jgi:hypothetical protein